ERAFTLADQARARSIYEHRAMVAGASPLAIDGDTALIEYAVLPDHLAIFVVRGGRISVDEVAVESATLRRSVDHFTDLLQRLAELGAVQQQARALSRTLFDPVARRVGSAKHLVIVPDRFLHGVPFSALFNEATHHYLIEDFTISVAANASQRIASGAG